MTNYYYLFNFFVSIYFLNYFVLILKFFYLVINFFSTMASIQRFVAGVFFAVLHQWGTLWVPNAYFNSVEFFVSFFKFEKRL